MFKDIRYSYLTVQIILQKKKKKQTTAHPYLLFLREEYFLISEKSFSSL